MQITQNIMLIMYLLNDKSQTFYFSPVFRAGCHNIDSGGVDAAVAQNIRQLGNVLFNTIKGSGKQLAKIMRKHLACLYMCLFAERLHLCPNTASIQRLSIPGCKNHAGMDAFFLYVG